MGQLSMEIYLKELRKRYLNAKKREKSEILSEFCDTFGYHRKHAIRLLNTPIIRKTKQKPGRKRLYQPEELLMPLKRIWLCANQPCGKRLEQAIPIWLPKYEASHGPLEQELYDKLMTISASTIDRLLSPLRIQYKPRYGGTKPGRILKSQIPIKTSQWDTNRPGFVEADTVAHCGGSLTGSFVWSLTVTDIFSGWTENRAVWNKGAIGVVEQVKDIEERLPFELMGFDCDNGSEFLNWHLMRYFSLHDTSPRIEFTRSRPYHKDDNAHVEQKNWTHVRQLLGYERLDNPKLTALINDLYKHEISKMVNFFLPNFKLVSKERVHSKVIKQHDKPKTPHQRLMNSEHISQEQKGILQASYEQLNPFELKKSIDRKLNRIFSIVNHKDKNCDAAN